MRIDMILISQLFGDILALAANTECRDVWLGTLSCSIVGWQIGDCVCEKSIVDCCLHWQIWNTAPRGVVGRVVVAPWDAESRCWTRVDNDVESYSQYLLRKRCRRLG